MAPSFESRLAEYRRSQTGLVTASSFVAGEGDRPGGASRASSQQNYLVDDATGTGAGRHVTISATQFTAGGSVTLANAGTFSATGSATSISAVVAPTAACSGSPCTDGVYRPRSSDRLYRRAGRHLAYLPSTWPILGAWRVDAA